MLELLQRAYNLHRAGRRAEAADLYQQVLAQDANQPDALQLLGLVHMQEGEPGRAVELIERASTLRPDSAPFHANLAEVYRALGRLERALEAARTALKLAPTFAPALANLGIILVALGRHDEAIEPLQQAVAQVPGLAAVHHILGLALIERGRAAEALPQCEAAVRLEPNRAIFQHNLGNCLQALGRFGHAQDAYLAALRLDAKLARPQANLGYVLHDMGRPDEAVAQLRQAIVQEPDNAAYWEALAELYDQHEAYAEAIPCWQRVVELAPGRARAYRALAVDFQEDNRMDEAWTQFQKALELAPNSQTVHLDLGNYYEVNGDLVAAEACLRTALRLQPDSPVAYGRLAHLLRGNLPDADLAAVEQYLADSTIAGPVRTQLLFGLSHVLDARGDYPRAAASVREANALTKARNESRGHGYVPAVHQLFIDGMRAVMGPALFERLAGAGNPTRRPVFIFGLPRSGTTLVEQVLASHPAVHGAGELALAFNTVARVPQVLGRPGPPLVCIEDLTPEALSELGDRHLADLAKLDGGRAARVVDKMPHNYLYLGVLALVFPDATFIHCRRDLRDVAVSCWMTGFRSLEWTNDIAHLASRFQQYLRLMDHWRRVLPIPVHEVVYEEFVTDLEGGARCLLAAAGLDWDPGCLEFYRTRRAVHTASFSQVRQPVYTKSIGRWKHYEKDLADLLALLPVGP